MKVTYKKKSALESQPPSEHYRHFPRELQRSISEVNIMYTFKETSLAKGNWLFFRFYEILLLKPHTSWLLASMRRNILLLTWEHSIGTLIDTPQQIKIFRGFVVFVLCI
eukprot:TRINITY_DN413_c0_g1_i1.p1 TRINITY_DN413_c0_g1~~TRINITY_DN413_c0_g1_i1.p1  ORF type:complete len:109 (-),score=3.82 TRINITY_DN413_c0_g1_i1:28-354(-)